MATIRFLALAVAPSTTLTSVAVTSTTVTSTLPSVAVGAATSTPWWVDALTTFGGTLLGALLAFAIAYWIYRFGRRDALRALKQSLAVALHATYLELRDNRNTIKEILDYSSGPSRASSSDWAIVENYAQTIDDKWYRLLMSSPGYRLLDRQTGLELYTAYSWCAGVKTTASLERERFSHIGLGDPDSVREQLECWLNLTQVASGALNRLEAKDAWAGSVRIVHDKWKDLEEDPA